MGIFGWPWRKSRGGPRAAQATDRVPEGCSLRKWPGELPAPSFTFTDGGVLLASTGSTVDVNVEVLRALFDGVEKALCRAHGPVRFPANPGQVSDLFRPATPEVVLYDDVVIWTLQEGVLDGWDADPLRLQELLRRFYGLASARRASRQFLQRILVRRSYFDEVYWMFRLIKGLGIDVWEMNADGTALLEAQRPDGMIVSIVVGKAIESTAASDLQRYGRERHLATLRGDEAALERIDAEERRMIESAIESSPPPREPPRPFEQAPLLRSLMSQAAGGDAAGREKLLRHLIERNTPLLIPSGEPSRGWVKTKIEEIGTERVVRVFPDLQSTRHFAPADRTRGVISLRAATFLELCRGGSLALLLEAPGENGPIGVIVRAGEVDALAAPS